MLKPEKMEMYFQLEMSDTGITQNIYWAIPVQPKQSSRE